MPGVGNSQHRRAVGGGKSNCSGKGRLADRGDVVQAAAPDDVVFEVGAKTGIGGPAKSGPRHDGAGGAEHLSPSVSRPPTNALRLSGPEPHEIAVVPPAFIGVGSGLAVDTGPEYELGECHDDLLLEMLYLTPAV